MEAAGVPLWAITGDEPGAIESFVEHDGIAYEVLLDPDGSTFRSYRILNERHDKTVPHPTVIVVDATGVARYVFTDENKRVRAPADEVVAAALSLVR